MNIWRNKRSPAQRLASATSNENEQPKTSNENEQWATGQRIPGSRTQRPGVSFQGLFKVSFCKGPYVNEQRETSNENKQPGNGFWARVRNN